MPKPRIWLAIVLSLLLGGLGQLYAGRVRRALGVFVLEIAAVPLIVAAFMAGNGSIAAMLGAIFGAVVFKIGITADAALCAHRGRLLPYSRVRRMLAYMIFGLLACLVLETEKEAIREFYAQAFVMPLGSMSMVPTLLPGDYFMVDRRAYSRNAPERGHVVVFHSPDKFEVRLVKRILAGPGDVVELRDGRIRVNGEPELSSAGRVTFPDQTIPIGHYFMIGDNRDNSKDSRTWGPISEDRILGRVRFIYFSTDRKTHIFRWERVGKRVEWDAG